MSRFVQLLQESFEQYKMHNYDVCFANLAEAKSIYSSYEDNSGLNLEDLFLFEGSIFYNLGNHEKALKSYESALRENPKSSSACLQLGRTFIQLEQYENAGTMLQYAVHLDESNTVARDLLDKLNEQLDLEEKTRTPEEVLETAYDLFARKKYSESLQALSLVEGEYKQMLASVYNFEGFNLLALRNVREAKAAFEKGKELNPDSSQSYAGLGEVLYLENNDYESKKMFELAVRLNPDNQFAVSGLKKVSAVLGSSAVSIIDLQSIEKNISDAFEKFSAKDFEGALQILENAERAFRQIDELEPNTMSRLLNFKGFSLLGLQRKDAAKTAFEEALQANPQSSQASAGLGEVLYLEDNLAAALQMFEWGVKLNPDNHFALDGVRKVKRLLGTD